MASCVEGYYGSHKRRRKDRDSSGLELLEAQRRLLTDRQTPAFLDACSCPVCLARCVATDATSFATSSLMLGCPERHESTATAIGPTPLHPDLRTHRAFPGPF